MILNPGSYIAIEGSIGAGKSSLAKLLAAELEADLILEEPASNPFLADFYRDPARWALQTQLTYLLQRHRQLAGLRQLDIFQKRVISDYLFDKDRMFAMLNLQERDLNLYLMLANALATDIPDPDLVVYLQSPVERQLTNLRIRDIPYERQITVEYLQSVTETYNNFFIHWTRTPLLIINTARIDFVNNPDQRKRLIELILNSPPGTTYFNPEA